MTQWINNWFSNWYPFDDPLIYQGIKFSSVETFYQAMKTEKHELELRARIAAMTAREAKHFSKEIKVRPDWEDIKLKVMEYALRWKFALGTSWHKKLIEETGEIVEYNNWGDTFWEVDVNSNCGENHLGELLMKLREEYKATPNYLNGGALIWQEEF